MSAPYRGPLTDALLEAMKTVGKPVGDALAPNEGGWQGEPNNTGSNFIPYCVLNPGVAGQASGPLSDPTADWHFDYNVSSFAISRNQCEWIADRVRGTVQSLKDSVLDLGPDKYTVQKAVIITIGSIQRVDVVNPGYWGQVDQLTVWMTKGL